MSRSRLVRLREPSLAAALSAACLAGWAGAPSITQQPAALGVQRGGTAVFTVRAVSAAPATAITYQWRRNGVAIAGATAASHTTPATTLSDDNALYSVQVRSAGVTVTSAATRLTVVPGFASASTGSGHSHLLGENGAVWTLGNSLPDLRANPGSFRNDQLSRAKTKAQALGSGLTGVAELASGMDRVIARRTDGTVVTWGQGVLGDGAAYGYQRYPVAVRQTGGAALSGVVSVAAGSDFGVAARTDGSAWSWGNNTMCVLATYVCTGLAFPPGLHAAPVLTSAGVALTGVTRVAAGKAMHALALRSDGTVWSWGTEYYGYLGNGTATLQRSLARPVLTVSGAVLSGVASITAGDEHSVAVRRDGTVYAWGNNTNGQLGIGVAGSSTSSMRAVKVMAGAGVALTGVAAAVATKDATLFLKADGSVWGVGSNNFRQLGNAASGTHVYPVRVLDLRGVALTGIRAVAAREWHALAVRTNGTVYAWGTYSPGYVPSPVLVPSP